MPTVYPFREYWKNAVHSGLVKLLCQLDFSRLIAGKETAFVLGTGHSILDLTEEQEEEIKAGFSIGINNWPMHPRIIPSVLLHEAAPDSVMLAWAQILQRQNSMWRMYGPDRVPWIIKDCWSAEFDISLMPYWLRENAYASSEQFVGGNIQEVEVDVGNMVRSGSFGSVSEDGFHVSAVPSRKASFVYATNLCAVLGFKRIVLYGIDLNRGNGHFYSNNKQDSGPHIVDDPRKSGYPSASDVFAAFHRKAYVPMGIDIVVPQSSALFNKINGAKK